MNISNLRLTEDGKIVMYDGSDPTAYLRTAYLQYEKKLFSADSVGVKIFILPANLAESITKIVEAAARLA